MHKGPYRKRYLPLEGHQCRKHPLYNIWAMMHQRCENNHPDYGGRGINVCRRWYCFDAFVADMGERPSPRHSIDRIDNSKGYCKSNCRWATRSDQALNRRKFTGSKTSSKGVIQRSNGYMAKMDYEGVRYTIGYFDTEEQANDARVKFERLFFKDRERALDVCKPKAKRNSSTGERGINPHADGGYTVRVTVNGKRIYLGYYQTLKEAVNARDTAIKE